LAIAHFSSKGKSVVVGGSDAIAEPDHYLKAGAAAIVLDKSGASYRLGSGDKIKITIYGEPNLSGTYLVNEEGYISFPLVEEVSVKDLTIIEARRILHAKLSDGYLIDPNIAIEVAEFRPIYVMGEVRNPGSFDFRTDMSVRNAVAIAGGFTYRANQKKIKVTRQLKGDDKAHIVLGKDDNVQPGDVILVEERFF
jgi:polysaccharide export outer membrane protein